MDEIWREAFEIIKTRPEMPSVVAAAWLSDAYVERIDNDAVTLVMPESRINAVKSRYLDLLNEVFTIVLRKKTSVEIVPERAAPDVKLAEEQEKHFTFDRFVVGPSNEFAYHASLAVAEGASQNYNPLFIYGNSGLGKTHLLYAIRNKFAELDAAKNIIMFSSEVFTRELIEAIRAGGRAEFHRKYFRDADVLIVDDIQFISGKDFAQEEFFHLYNNLRDFGKQVVIASDQTPRDLPKLSDRLRSRFEQGLIVDIKPPNFEMRIAIVNAKARLAGRRIPDPVAQYIAEKITANVRQLEGIVRKLNAYHDLMGLSLSMETAAKAVEDLLKEDNPMTPDKILGKVCEYYGVDIEDVISGKRVAKITQTRQVAMFLIRELCDKSFHDIGELFKRDHTTVMHANDKIKDKIAAAKEFEIEINAIKKNIAEA